jgi:hypothetical protein
MEPNASRPGSPTDWEARQRDWGRRLGRLRLGAEPIEVQLERYRRVTWVLTAIPAFLALFFVGLFTAFGRPDIGSVLAAVLLLPVVTIAWLDYARLHGRAMGYLRELREHERRRPPDAPGANGSLPSAS